jgi:hypothetical protein
VVERQSRVSLKASLDPEWWSDRTEVLLKLNQIQIPEEREQRSS